MNPIGPEAAVSIERTRVEYAQAHAEMISLQKACGAAGDRDGARFFKDEARDRLKIYRAACLLLPWVVSEPPGDCVQREPEDWPEELHPAIRFVAGIASVATQQ